MVNRFGQANELPAQEAQEALGGKVSHLIPDDVKVAAPPILRHRLVLKPEADLEGMTADQVVREIVRSVEVPK